MSGDVTPQHSAFLSAVLRFLTLHHGRSSVNTPEYYALRSELWDEPLGAMRPAWEQRSYWRMEFPAMKAYVRRDGLQYPCHLVDLSGTGARITDTVGRVGVAARAGDRVILSLRPARSTLQIELPVEVVHHDAETGTFGLRFRAAPLVTHRRDTLGHARKRPPTARGRHGHAPAPAMEADLLELPMPLRDAPVVSDPHSVPANDTSHTDVPAGDRDPWVDFNVA